MEKNKRKKGILFNKIIFWFTLILFINSIVLFIVVEDASLKSQFALNCFQCFCMLVLMFLPRFVSKHFKYEIPKIMQIIYVSFCFGGLVLGDVYNFFDRFPYWDSILHSISGVLLAALGFIIMNTLNGSARVKMTLSPTILCISVVLFALALGALWEIIEFLIDDIFGSNMQQFMQTTEGTLVGAGDVPLQGHEALRDTMKDLMLGLGGAIIIAVVGYFELKRGKKGISQMELEQIDQADLEKNTGEVS